MAGIPPISFELFPPRSDAAAIALGRTIDRLAAVDPSFISVTYGANGSTRGRSITVLSYILSQTHIRAMAHLTCIGNSYAEASDLIREFLDAGITSFLALRGDPPQGTGEEELVLGDLSSASQLVQLIHRVQEEKLPFTSIPTLGLPKVNVVQRRRQKVEVAVAAFPNGHPRSRDPRQDIDTLLAKQAAGADFALTQAFFEPEEYLNFAEAAKAAGVTIPLIPGIMPIRSLKRMERVAELTGEHPKLLDQLRATETVEEQSALGHQHAVELVNALRNHAPGFHIYTFNTHQAALELLADTGLSTTLLEKTP